MAIYLSAFIFVAAFGLVWHIIWMSLGGVIASIICVIVRSFDEDTEYVIPAAEVEKMDKLAWTKNA
jgi:cytochrome o ubiquinol oxidase subunit 1